MKLRELWKRIADWHKRNTPQGKFCLAKGVSKQQLAAFEKVLGLLLPDDVRESYLCHNGTAGTWLLYFGEVMSLPQVETMWRRYDEWQQESGYGLGVGWQPGEIKGPIKSIWWSPLRIPITDNAGGDPVMIDLDPGKGGHRGQVIKFNHEVGPINVLEKSLSAWLSEIADGLEAGKFVYIEGENTVAPPGFYG